MVKFKGRSRSTKKQYMKKQPIKIWTRCDAKSGYFYFDIYTGKSKTLPEEGLGCAKFERVAI